jgi:hypothetical protein
MQNYIYELQSTTGKFPPWSLPVSTGYGQFYLPSPEYPNITMGRVKASAPAMMISTISSKHVEPAAHHHFNFT